MSFQYSITGLGFCSWDYVCAIPRVPVDGKVEVLRRLNQGGGPAATATYAAQRLGAKTAFIGVTGDDEGGRNILEEFRDGGVDVSAMVIRPGAEASVAFCWAEQETGHRSIAWARGTAASLRPEEVDLGLVRSSRVLHLDGHQMAAALHAAATARAAGVLVCLDAGTMLSGIEDLVDRSDIVIASERFGQEFTGYSEVNDALSALHQHGARLTVITRGALGSIGFDGRERVRIPAFPVRVADTTGAGDVYHGAFLCRHLEGGGLAESMRFAAAAAALKCEVLGGRSGIPTRASLEAFLSRNPKQE